MMNKKFLSIMLALTMLFTMMPLTTFATETETVYISVSDDSQYVSDQNGNPVAYTAVSLDELASVDLESYDLGAYVYDADGDGTPEITALHLYIYVHEKIMGLDWSEVYITGSAGSIYFAGGLFGFSDENLRYDYNGAYPAVDGWGLTADQIVLYDGDFLNVAHYTSWAFWGDSITGFHYFTDTEGNITYNYNAEPGESITVNLVRSYSDWMSGGGTALAQEPDYTVYYGDSYGVPVDSAETDDYGSAMISVPTTPGTYYVWADGGYGMENTDDIVSAPAFATITVTAPVFEPADPIDVYVSIADKGEVVMANDKVTVTDRDASGDFTVDEVLYAAHETAYDGGAAAGYGLAMGDYGLYITKLWGDVSGNCGYWLNDAACWSPADTVAAGDSVVAFVYQNTEVWDSYSKFAQDSYTAMAETATTVTLEKAGYDASWNTVFAGHKGATIKVYDDDFKELATTAYKVVDNGDGTYAITVNNIGTYTFVAYDNATPIVPAICTLTVTQNPDLVFADAVEVKIDTIGTVTSESKTAIEEARAAYNALSDAQKALVSNYAVLTAAEEALTDIQQDIEAADAVEEKINAIGAVTAHSGSKVRAARAAYDALTDAQKAYVENLSVLTAAESTISGLYAEAAIADHKAIYEATGKYISGLGTPYVGSTGGEWMVIDLTRAGYDCPEGYYQNVVDYVNEKINDKEQLHRAKSTDNSRVILALTAAGYDVTDVDGHNLLMGLTDMTYIKKQGINGPIWALIAFDCYDYEIPANADAAEQVTRENLIAYILEKQLEDGGWALSGTVADPDMTGMAIQSLAPYYNTNADVKMAVDEALVCLSNKQYDNGGFGSIDGTCSESCAQVIVALTALGINPETDARFVKNGVSVVDAMCLFAVEGGGFAHIPDGGLNGMATEQSQYALASYFRFLDGKTSLYDMSDVTMRVDEAAANTVKGLISSIGTVTKDSKETIEAARTAYDALTDAQKALVENYSVLTSAEADYAKLNTGSEMPDTNNPDDQDKDDTNKDNETNTNPDDSDKDNSNSQKPESSDKVDSPQTGDNNHIGLYVALMLVSALGLIALMITSKKFKISER